MQDNVGIVRDEDEMQSALEDLKTFWERASQRRCHRQSRIQSGLAYRARSEKSADRFRSDHARGARAKGKSRRAIPRRLSG